MVMNMRQVARVISQKVLVVKNVPTQARAGMSRCICIGKSCGLSRSYDVVMREPSLPLIIML